MLVLTAKDVEEAMDYASLTEALRQSFRSHIVTPVRHHHTIDFPDQAAATLLLMPAWKDAKAAGTSNGGYIGIKILTVYPDNETRALKPSILGSYLLMDGANGEVKAVLDGPDPDGLAHGLRLSTRCRLSGEVGFLIAPHGRHRCLVEPSHSRPLRRSSHQESDDLGPQW